MNKLLKYITDSKYRFYINTKIGITNMMSDEKFLKKKFKITMGEKLDLDNPKTFNQKLQWLKIHDRKPEYTRMVDKYEAKNYVKQIDESINVIKTLGVWDKFDDIDFDKLPNKFVLKCTHDSGGIVICKDKNTFDIKKAKKTITKCLKTNFYQFGREWPYKNVKPRIIAEEYVETPDSTELIDYKFYCFDGKPQFLYISSGLDNHPTALISFLDLDWKFAPYKRSDYKSFDKLPNKPFSYAEMIEHAKILSKNCKFLRVDLYEIDRKVYFSELTFFPCSGYMPFTDRASDLEIGSFLNLDNMININI